MNTQPKTAFDLWVYTGSGKSTRYLLMHTSKAKADKWFGGSRFWQIPTDFIVGKETTMDGIDRQLKSLRLNAKSIWACEYVYTIYNRRYDSIITIPVFAAEVELPVDVPLTWEHSESGWFTASECEKRLGFHGLKEGLRFTRKYVTENVKPLRELRLLPRHKP